VIGQTVGHYSILDKLGEGGMGAVYKARDLRLERFVALKFLPTDKMADEERRRRLALEAKAASALNHPNIITIHEIGEHEGHTFIVMELVDGKPLNELIPRKGMRLTEALRIAVQAADALTAAHAAGIVHRDLKPANIMVDTHGRVKVLDFGLAKLSAPSASATLAADESTRTVAMDQLTEEGAIVGSVPYMSPEQAEGIPVDARSDLFSFGSVLYEMLAGHRPFQGDSDISIRTAILREMPVPLKRERKHLPAELERIVGECLEKDRERRYQSARELWQDLSACQAHVAGVGLRGFIRKPQYAVPALALLVALVAGVVWSWVKYSRVRWAHDAALPQVQRLLDQKDFYGAFALAQKAIQLVPDDPKVQACWGDASWEATIATSPPGAGVYIRDYYAPERAGSWSFLGKSPIRKVRIPWGVLRWRIQKEGFETLEVGGGMFDSPDVGFALHSRDSAPKNMVFIPGQSLQVPCFPGVKV